MSERDERADDRHRRPDLRDRHDVPPPGESSARNQLRRERQRAGAGRDRPARARSCARARTRSDSTADSVVPSRARHLRVRGAAEGLEDDRLAARARGSAPTAREHGCEPLARPPPRRRGRARPASSSTSTLRERRRIRSRIRARHSLRAIVASHASGVARDAAAEQAPVGGEERLLERVVRLVRVAEQAQADEAHASRVRLVQPCELRRSPPGGAPGSGIGALVVAASVPSPPPPWPGPRARRRRSP